MTKDDIILKNLIIIPILILLMKPSPSDFRGSNFQHSIEFIEETFACDNPDFKVPRDIRIKGDKTKRATFICGDKTFVTVKFKKAATGGDSPNNKPRFEIAAYRLQKLFLDPPDFVVPPTTACGFPLKTYQQYYSQAEPTFKGTSSVLCTIQYWLSNVTKLTGIDKSRFESDSLYAYHIGNLNIFSYLVRHYDSNPGNFLISTDKKNPRAYVVDNGIAFGDSYGNRGHQWKDILVDRLPKSTVQRLRQITLDDLTGALTTVAQYEIKNGQLIAVPPGKAVLAYKGVRFNKNFIQFGLRSREIEGIYNRLLTLLAKIDRGEIQVF